MIIPIFNCVYAVYNDISLQIIATLREYSHCTIVATGL